MARFDHASIRLRDPGFLRSLPRLCAAALLLLVACSGGTRPVSGTAVNITLRDFAIATSTSNVVGPDVVFSVHNIAPATHEFVVIRTDLEPDQLPIGSDGLRVNEDAFTSPGEISEVETQSTETLSLHLAPGHYVFFCNLEGHYLGGMHGALEVTGSA